MAFEKASVLFNVGALYTQIGTKQNRSNAKGLDAAVDNFLRSAGTFQYILENFTNAPSMDLNPGTLEFLVHLMCAQARECLFEKGELVLFETALCPLSPTGAKVVSRSSCLHGSLKCVNGSS